MSRASLSAGAAGEGMEFKADALLLRAVDYGENDKMATLLTAERGKIGAALKGVRKAGAKLRFAAQPFCFAEYVFAERGGRFTVTQASLHDGFYDIRTDLAAYYAAASVTEMCGTISFEGMPCGALLVCAVEALEALDADQSAPERPLLKFLLEAAALAGYPVSAGDCPGCGKKIAGRRFFDMTAGAFNCADCAQGVPASASTYEAIRAFLTKGELPPEREGYIRAVRLLKAYLTYHTEAELPALGEFLRLSPLKI